MDSSCCVASLDDEDIEQDENLAAEILIVSDDAFMPGREVDNFERLGITVRVIGKNQVLPQRLAENKPELILLDFSLSSRDGLAVCKSLKGSVATQDIPVIFMFNVEDLDKRLQGFKAGAIDYVLKPVLAEEVILKVGHILARKRAAVCKEQERILSRQEQGYRTSLDNIHASIFRYALGGQHLFVNPASESASDLSAESSRGQLPNCLRLLAQSDAHKRLITILEESADFIGCADVQGNLLYHNRTARRMLGLPDDAELSGMKISDIHPEWVMDLLLETAIPALHEQDVWRGETALRHVGGREIPVSQVLVMHRDTEGRPEYYSTIMRDISERIRSESLILERLKLEKRLSRMVNHIPGFLFTFKMDDNCRGCFPYVSSGIKDIYGLKSEDVAEDMWALHRMVHQDDRPGFDAALFRAVRTRSLFHYETRICHPDKGILWVEAKSAPVLEPDGSLVFHGFMLDITERKKVESTLNFIAQAGWQESGAPFLVSLACFMAELLGVEYVIIDKLTTVPDHAQTVAFYARGAVLPNTEYGLKGTPCENVMEGRLCCYALDVQTLFPDDKLLVDMQVESYAGMPLRDSTGKVIGLIAVMDSKPMLDTSMIVSILKLVAIRVATELERDKYERMLADSRQFLRRVIDTIAEPVFVKDRQHRWILLNQAFCEFIGLPQEELLGKSDYDFFPSCEADEFWLRDESVFNSGKENVNEESFTDRNGMTHTIITKKTRYIDDRGEVILVGIVLDITERKQMEETIRKREEEFRTLSENLPDAIVRYDKICRRIYVNKVYCNMLGLAGVDVVGKTPMEFWPYRSPGAEEFMQKLNRVMEMGENETLILESESKQGWPLHLRVNLTPEYNLHGVTLGVLACAFDISGLKEYEKQLEASRSQLRALAARCEKLREDERKRIARELHDDLGQRLTALRMDLSRLMLRFGVDNQKLMDQLQEMEENVGATIQIVRDVATSLRPATLEMGIDSALKWLAEEFYKRTTVRCQLRINPQKMELDDNQATALFRIVQESLTNIMRYAKASEVRIGLDVDSNNYILEISDDGIGFDSEKSITGSFGLIGIEERALILGGEVLILSEPGKGVKLRASIPLSPPKGDEL